MNEFNKIYREEFKDKETREIYADDFLNTSIATQIKVLREQRELTQAQLAEKAEMAQERISVMEDVNYSSWTIKTLKRLAHAFDVRLVVKFESFGSLLSEFEAFNRENLERPSFDDDPAFADEAIAQAVGAVHTYFVPSLNLPPIGLSSSIDLALAADWDTELNVVVHGVKLIRPPVASQGHWFRSYLDNWLAQSQTPPNEPVREEQPELFEQHTDWLADIGGAVTYKQFNNYLTSIPDEKLATQELQ